MLDLLGSDLPDPDQGPGRFRWSPRPFLRAIQNGHWVLLDELNLAWQTVLSPAYEFDTLRICAQVRDGLNAVWDHRGTVLMSELSRSFSTTNRSVCFRVRTQFMKAASEIVTGLVYEPIHQCRTAPVIEQPLRGCADSITQVHLEEVTGHDLHQILQRTWPDAELRLVKFNGAVHRRVCIDRDLGQVGSPWEFNLGDVFRETGHIYRNEADRGGGVGMRRCASMSQDVGGFDC